MILTMKMVLIMVMMISFFIRMLDIMMISFKLIKAIIQFQLLAVSNSDHRGIHS